MGVPLVKKTRKSAMGGDDRGMFERLRFYSNGFPLWCNDLILFCCMMVLLMTTGQS